MSLQRSVPEPRPGILEIAPYVPGKAGAAGIPAPYKLSSNESALGASPRAAAAFRETVESLHLYPDGSAGRLRQAIADRHGLNPDHIVCGAGSDELLSLLAHAYLGPGDEAIHTAHGFLVYPIAIRACGAVPVVAPEHDYTASVDEILTRVTPRTKMVFLANPNNPTGTYLSFEEVKRLHGGLPESCLLVLDAAYAEYVRRNDYAAGIELVAIADQAHLDAAITHNQHWLPWLSRHISELGLEVTPSAGNFILIHFPAGERSGAAAADAFLNQHGLVLRRMESYGLPRALRATVGSEAANRALVVALQDFTNGAS